MTHLFPQGFVWGSATSAYQVEGAWDAEGKVPSIWDTAMHSTLVTPDGSTGDRAIDQYHCFEEDFDLLRELGGTAHRFSTSWPRIVVDAAGTVNPAGLDHYDRVVDALLTRGIDPALCLFHWDTPQWMEDLGGMLTRDFADRFAEYAGHLGERLGDRVAQWYTLNEPVNPTLGGYLAGGLPPYRTEGVRGGLLAAHHLLLAHGRSVQALRAAGVSGEIGSILSLGGVVPATEHPEDLRAAERAEYFESRLFLDPLFGRGHLPEVAAVLGDAIHEGDLETIAQPLDIFGLNWYSQYAASSPERADTHAFGVPERGAAMLGLARATAPLGFAVVPTPGARWGGAHRQLTPGGFRRMLDWLAATYPEHPDIIITENGVGGADLPGEDGIVHDSERIDFLGWALAELAQAITDGARVRGYHAWSSIDNLQWMAGFTHRFGLIHVDAHTLKRTPKDSFHWFREVIRRGSVPAVAAGSTGAPATGDHAGITVQGVRNARGVGGLRLTEGGTVRDGALLRTAGLHALEPAGRDALLAQGVCTIIDLRGRAESSAAPDPSFGPTLVSLPLHEPGAGSGTLPSLPAIYREIIEHRGADIVAGIREILAAGDGTVLVHCTAGKDRTGVFIALLLSAVGVCDEDVIASYAESAQRLGQPFAEEVQAHFGGVLIPEDMRDHLLASPAEYIVDTLAQVRRDYGSTWAYLLAHGLGEQELAALRAHFRG
ncbi:family 1 glycosylhydrolase [Mycetocola spongiae]|uniref:family 1 glycosylhydrolase n=1 Tax=Mycetocola spongiae TaxID=2859226 RepID=UPI001CF3549A|nr:family 1 glycosylhydrolase [Mycetocola spongiae]UCR89457.1 family 1 glycosylhydrolase [Mycetocola spongiae]